MLDGLYSTAAGMSGSDRNSSNAIGERPGEPLYEWLPERAHRDSATCSTTPVDQAGTVTTVGAGAGARQIGASAVQGAIKLTGDPLDLAIVGQGYIQLTLPDGKSALTRNGALNLSANGMITDAQGNLLDPPIKVPAGISEGELGDRVRTGP